jgi:hypothetical protein
MGYYKKMIEQARSKGVATEAMMWGSIEEVDQMLEQMKEHHKQLYWDFMHNQHKIIYKGHYNEEFAEYELEHVYYINKVGEKTNKPYWTIEQIEEATRGFNYPQGTTKWDKWVAHNTFRSDTMKSLPDDLALKSGWEFFFDDIDFKKEGTTKLWEYMHIK